MIIRGSLERLSSRDDDGSDSRTFIARALGNRRRFAPGKEILHPLAVVVLGGILTSTLLDQIVTPAVFFKFGRHAAEKIIRERESKGSENEWGAAEAKDEPDKDVPPFSERIPNQAMEG